jgi:hypothetical protein
MQESRGRRRRRVPSSKADPGVSPGDNGIAWARTRRTLTIAQDSRARRKKNDIPRLRDGEARTHAKPIGRGYVTYVSSALRIYK